MSETSRSIMAVRQENCGEADDVVGEDGGITTSDVMASWVSHL